MKALAALAHDYLQTRQTLHDVHFHAERRLAQLREERARNKELALQVQQLTDELAKAQETIRIQEAANNKLRKRIRDLEAQ